MIKMRPSAEFHVHLPFFLPQILLMMWCLQLNQGRETDGYVSTCLASMLEFREKVGWVDSCFFRGYSSS